VYVALVAAVAVSIGVSTVLARLVGRAGAEPDMTPPRPLGERTEPAR
jgi:hypothetical protein